MELRMKDAEELEVRRRVMEELRLHFVFNALNGIRFLVRSDPERAYEAIYDLAKYLQGLIAIVLETKPIPLREELQFLKAYLNLECLHRTNLVVEIAVPCLEKNATVMPGCLYRVAQELLKGNGGGSKRRTLAITLEENEQEIALTIMETGDGKRVTITGEEIDEIKDNLGG